MVFSVFRTSIINVAANTDYFVFKIDFYADLATESSGPCAGCSDQAAIVFNRLGLLAPASPTNEDEELLTAACATWNGGTSICGVTPTQNKTWGALKSLYR